MSQTYSSGEHYVEPTAIGKWVRSPGVRETVEAILIAILLALLFRYFEAEAFVIPTGSMAPDLQGRHVDVICPQCGIQVRGGASTMSDVPQPVKETGCPICQYDITLKRGERRDHRPFSGDRILVNKFAYDFGDPERWDVIVFKYPNNGKQNFIKRLVGLPNEGMLIEFGDIYTFNESDESFADRKVATKPPKKLFNMLQLVDDTNHVAQTLVDAGWPSRWNEWSEANATDRKWKVSEGHNQFSLANKTDQDCWLRYRHYRPRRSDWEGLELIEPKLPERYKKGLPPGELITDYYAYNDVLQKRVVGRDENGRFEFREMFPADNGIHWVGDLAVEAEFTVDSESGKVTFQLVEGGAEFNCTIDVSSGDASFDSNDNRVSVEAKSLETSIKGTGKYKILFANADNNLYLWVNKKFVGSTNYSRTGDVYPEYDADKPGDAEPVGVNGTNIDLNVTRLKVLRDIYYVSKNRAVEADLPFQSGSTDYLGAGNIGTIKGILQNPTRWNTAAARKIFDSRKRSEAFVFHLAENQLLPMGDNSPQSKDARLWEGAPFIDQSYLLGKALFVYWPHAKTKPLPFWPNFKQMKFIR